MSEFTYPYLAISDGTLAGTVILQDAIQGVPAYMLDLPDHWVPAIPTLADATLSGRGPVNDAEEEFPVIISGRTPAEVTAKRATLINLLDQARAWRMGQNVLPVLMKYVPAGSAVYDSGTPLQAAILGRTGEESGVPISNFQKTGDPHMGWCQQVAIRLKRRGQWLGSAESVTSTPAAGSGARHHMAFSTSLVEFSPLKLTIDNLTPGAALSLLDSFVFVARNKAGTSTVAGSYLQSYAAETMTATGWTAVASAGNNPLGTNVLRYTPTGTTFVASGALTLTSPLTLCKRVYVYATVRNNNATRTFQLGGQFISAGGTKTLSLPYTFIDNSIQTPRAICLGSMALPVDSNTLPNATFPTFKLIAAVSSITGSPTLDVDNIVFVGCDDEGGNVMTLRAFTIPAQSNIDITFDPQSLTMPTPTATLEYSSTIDFLSYEGNLWSNTILQRVTCLWLATQGTNWRFANNANVLQTFTFTATRRPAYLVPQ